MKLSGTGTQQVMDIETNWLRDLHEIHLFFLPGDRNLAQDLAQKTFPN